ncbi:cation-translocating P-type ATPase [Leptospira idonii]|uniref:Cation-translocating P-type ATPase n=1 Tax=Leptospira idonii TaxID=1193500 RepID=A0A4R9M200_9LEPT|nr:cation-translocating P-type ATPase [Leptospira idonii]TGN19981.1 cation-translocating P-type ATPase [Leptospira idonii]
MLNEIESQYGKGLSEKEVISRRKLFGYNELSSPKSGSLFSKIMEVITEPMISLLLSIVFVYLLVGDAGEAILLSCSVLLIMIITVYQEGRTETAIHALKSLASPRTNVLRDGRIVRVDGRDIVPDDIIFIGEGDRIPADCILLSSEHISTDESLLTGESVPVSKKKEDEIYCGSLVSSGGGVCSVRLTGQRTQIGKIGKTISEEKSENTLLEKEVQILVKRIFVFASILCVSLAAYFGLVKGEWLQGLLSGLTLAIALLPEELPLVLTIFFAFGAYRLSRAKVLARRPSIIETLGAATVLCTDKTGTITQNKMKIHSFLFPDGRLHTVSGKKTKEDKELISLLEAGIFASKPNSFDPMEKAFFSLGETLLSKTDSIFDRSIRLEKEFPLSPDFLAMIHIWDTNETNNSFAKGAPEAILAISKLDENSKTRILEQTSSLAKQGLRILAVASGHYRKEDIPSEKQNFDLDFLGLVGFEDPIRESVPDAVKLAYRSGMRIIMITGDYPETAVSIAKQIGLKSYDQVLTGNRLSQLSEEEFEAAVMETNIFSRVSPNDKWNIVRVLKKKGEIVAMTGDGVNDAPALKTAHIGVAMGARGTDVAREASDLVLLDDSFSSVLKAVEQGRHIYDNLKKALAYIIGVHIPIVGAAFLPIVFDWPIAILSAVHIVFLELVIDPTCTLVFEKEAAEKGIMDLPPRQTNVPLLNKRLFLISFFQGVLSLTAVVLVYWIMMYRTDFDPNRYKTASTSAFVSLIFSNLLLILTNRNWSETIWQSFRAPNQALPYVLVGSSCFLFASIYLPYLQTLFHFVPLSAEEVMISFFVAFFSVIWFEFGKLIWRKKDSSMQNKASL